MKTKLIYFILFAFPCFVLLSSCQDEKGDLVPPAQVSNIAIVPDFGGFKISWQNPADEDFYYVDLSYTDASGKDWSKKVSRYASQTQISGLTEEKEYTIHFTCYDLSGNASGSQSVKGTCKTPPFLFVAQKLNVNPDFGGINVKWDNTTGKQISVQVQYKDNNGAKQRQTTTSNKASDVLYLSGLVDKSQIFSITVADSIGNVGIAKEVTITPLAESKIAKTGWTVVSFSSEEATGEGPANGKVMHAIDDNINSFWHSQWSGASPVYPHWFVIDMGKTVTISRFELTRRQGNSGGPDKVKFYAGTNGQTWTDLGEFSFNRTINTTQNYRVASNPVGRYFKFEAVAGPNSFTNMAELSVYGSSN